MNFGLNFLATYQSTSASTSRPSASVLMISMVWPDIEVTISPGRCALPSGMFSTRPMAPTTLTFALRAASACIRPTTQAAPPMSPFMSSMLPRRLDRNAAGIEAHALADEGDRLLAALAAVPAHDHGAAGPRRALRDAEQRAHAEFGHRLDVENLDLDAELAQLAGAAREFLGVEHVRRLVDEFARDDDAIDDVRAGRESLPRGGHIADRERDVGAQGGILAVLLFGLVAVELVGAQPHARGDRGRLIGLHGAVGNSAMIVTASLPALSLPAAAPPNLRKSLSLRPKACRRRPQSGARP